MGHAGPPGGAVLTDQPAPPRRWLLVRSVGASPEERDVVRALAEQLAPEGIDLVSVLLGEACHEVERAAGVPSLPGRCWILEDDARGRGVRPTPGRGTRVLSYDELAEEIMSADRVISLP